MISSSAQLKIAKSVKQDKKMSAKYAEKGNLSFSKQSQIISQSDLEKQAAEIATLPKEEQISIFNKMRADIQSDLQKQSRYRSLRALVDVMQTAEK